MPHPHASVATSIATITGSIARGFGGVGTASREGHRVYNRPMVIAPNSIRTASYSASVVVLMIAVCTPSARMVGADAKGELAPTGTLRGAFLGRNPVQAVMSPATREYAGPVPDMLKEIASELGVPYQLIPSENAQAVMDAVNGHTADIGFLA